MCSVQYMLPSSSIMVIKNCLGQGHSNFAATCTWHFAIDVKLYQYMAIYIHATDTRRCGRSPLSSKLVCLLWRQLELPAIIPSNISILPNCSSLCILLWEQLRWGYIQYIHTFYTLAYFFYYSYPTIQQLSYDCWLPCQSHQQYVWKSDVMSDSLRWELVGWQVVGVGRLPTLNSNKLSMESTMNDQVSAKLKNTKREKGNL